MQINNYQLQNGYANQASTLENGETSTAQKNSPPPPKDESNVAGTYESMKTQDKAMQQYGSYKRPSPPPPPPAEETVTEELLATTEEDSDANTVTNDTSFIVKAETQASETDEANRTAILEAVEQMQLESEESMLQLLQSMVQGNVENQASALLGESSSDLLTDVFGSLDAALPALATDPAEAQAAIEDGGPYSVEAVTERLLTMAKALAQDDPSKIEMLQEAMQKGFEMAGMNLETGEGMPEITFETYKAAMAEFEVWKQEAGVA